MGCATSRVTEVRAFADAAETMRNAYERKIRRSLSGLPSSDEAAPENKDTRVASGARVAPTPDGDPESTTEQNEPSKNLIFFDFDDTICPTTWAKYHLGFRSDGRSAPRLQTERDQQMKDVSGRAVTILTEALRLGEVVLVTNASRDWVKACCDELVPEAKALIKRVAVVYAMELMNAAELASFPKEVLQTESKSRAMRAVLSSFGKACKQSPGCVNVMSIGDGEFERTALREVVEKRAHVYMPSKRCFAKTIKMAAHPTLDEMQLQLSILSEWLPSIVHTDSHLDIDLAAP